MIYDRLTLIIGVDEAVGEAITIIQCNDCGAHADSIDKIVHFPNCELGSSEKWKEFYDGGID